MLIKNFEIVNKFKNNFIYNVIRKFTDKDYYLIIDVINQFMIQFFKFDL